MKEHVFLFKNKKIFCQFRFCRWELFKQLLPGCFRTVEEPWAGCLCLFYTIRNCSVMRGTWIISWRYHRHSWLHMGCFLNNCGFKLSFKLRKWVLSNYTTTDLKLNICSVLFIKDGVCFWRFLKFFIWIKWLSFCAEVPEVVSSQKKKMLYCQMSSSELISLYQTLDSQPGQKFPLLVIPFSLCPEWLPYFQVMQVCHYN